MKKIEKLATERGGNDRGAWHEVMTKCNEIIDLLNEFVELRQAKTEANKNGGNSGNSGNSGAAGK